ncbi:MAG TPA: ComF family protein [Castellaniella sp.]|nr:ComF family protein [Castellaniella sp.]
MRHLTDWRDWRRWVPADCPGCGRRLAGQGLCAGCADLLAGDPGIPRCGFCAHPLAAGRCPDCPPGPSACDRVIAAFDYTGLGRVLVHDYKIRRRLSLAGLLADRLAQAVRGADGPAPGLPDWIVPVPAHRTALRLRGFSPPAELARLLARRLGPACRLDGVRRVREGPKQAVLGRTQRLRAQAGAYACDGGVAGARIAIVDDVLTTGATMQAVAGALKTAGAARVEGWVLARALRRGPPDGAGIPAGAGERPPGRR